MYKQICCSENRGTCEDIYKSIFGNQNPAISKNVIKVTDTISIFGDENGKKTIFFNSPIPRLSVAATEGGVLSEHNAIPQSHAFSDASFERAKSILLAAPLELNCKKNDLSALHCGSVLDFMFGHNKPRYVADIKRIALIDGVFHFFGDKLSIRIGKDGHPFDELKKVVLPETPIPPQHYDQAVDWLQKFIPCGD